MSEDDFKGYLTDDKEDDGDNDEGDGHGDGDDSEDDDGNDSGDGDDNSTSLPEYTQHLGCTCNVTNKALIDFFQLFFTDKILESIVEQTNLFAHQYTESHKLSHHSRVQQWVRSARLGRTKEVPRSDHHNGADKFPIHQGLLDYILALRNFHLQLHHES